MNRSSAHRLRLLIATLFCLALAAPARSQDAISITFSDALDYTFGQQASFRIQASSLYEITAIYLYLRPAGRAVAESHPAPIEPGLEVNAAYQRDLRLSPLPPFVQVEWWWEIRDASGDVLMTDPSSFQYVDNRFEWQTVSAGRLRVHTALDDPAYAQQALDVALTALERIERELEAPPIEQANVYLYPSVADLRAALEMGGREWAGGQARPELGVALVAIPPGDGAVRQMERDIPHELAHLVTYQVMGPIGYTYLPAWLNEGLATIYELRPDPSLEMAMETARQQSNLIPLNELCAPFPASRDAALLSYAQSASIVRYVRDRYGNSGIRALLAAYADGAGCEGGIERALGIPAQRFEIGWRADLLGLSGWMVWVDDNAAWLVLWGISLMLTLPMVSVARRTSRQSNRGDGT